MASRSTSVESAGAHVLRTLGIEVAKPPHLRLRYAADTLRRIPSRA
ncbi:MAG: hypothetical protein WC081_05115 [Candidatus Ratteibacteria bacterium]